MVSTTEDAAKTITLAGSDPEGGSLTYALASNPSHGSATLSGSSGWRKQYGGMEVNQARRLKELEQENGRLKRLVADQALALSIHKEVSRGNF